MKTKEELNALKEEVEALNNKLAELSDEELQQVAGGTASPGLVTPLIDVILASGIGGEIVDSILPPVSGDIVDSIPSCWAKH